MKTLRIVLIVLAVVAAAAIAGFLYLGYSLSYHYPGETFFNWMGWR